MASADRLIEVFNEAKTRPAGAERERFLSEACRDEPELKQQVLSLLQAHEGAGDFLKNTQFIPAVTPLTEKPGDRIGRYKLLEQIGEGGCGVVYMAEQQEPVRRRVALKVIKLGMDTKQVIARFEAERQALAMMDHPNIAKVLDAGATDAGRPFFVMELVRGIKITDYCDQNNLSTNDRLELFIQVCQAIQHAHQKGIIHRDIKPSNILVTQHDDVAVPKVIDFGIAKATIGHLTDRTLFTAFAQFMGTPAYMSPEQAQMSGLDIDTRADIYSLGVLLYELLTGNTPFDAKALLAAGMDEMRRKIREDEPAKPSTCLSTMQLMDLTIVARHRHAEPPRLIHLIRGDLDWLVMKCLEKDRTRRYETANALAMDLQRHLNDEPVVACPPSRSYRFQKLVRRNKLAFAAASAVTAALVIGLCISTWMFFGEKQARQRAVTAEQKTGTEAAKSQQVSQFLKDMLESVGPSVALGRDTTMLREILDHTAERIRTDLKDQPDVQIELHLTLAEVHFQLQEFKKMEQTARQTLALARSHLGAESLPAADALGQLGLALCNLRSLEEAETVTRQAIAMQKKLRGSDTVEEGKALYRLGDVLRLQSSRTEPPVSERKLIEAEDANRAGLAILRKRLGNDNDEVSTALYLRSMTLMAESKQAEAEDAIRESLAIRQRLHGDEYPSVQYGFMSYVLMVRGKLDEAEACARRALELQRKMGLVGKLSQVNTYYNLGNILLAKGKPDEAESHYREGLRIARKEVDSEYRDLPNWLVVLAKILRTNGKLAEARSLAEEAVAICDRHPDSVDRWARDGAFFTLIDVLTVLGDAAAVEAMFREDLAVRRKQFGKEHRSVEHSLAALAKVLHQEGKLAEAETVWREELAVERKLSGDEHPFVANSLQQLAAVLQEQGKLAEAETTHREALALRRKLPADDRLLAGALAGLTSTRLAAQKFPEAESLARECLTIREKKLPDDWLTFNARSMLGGSLLGQKKFLEAEPLLLSGYEGMKQREDKIPASSKRYVKETLQRLVRLYEATGQPQKAAEWNKKLAELDQAEAEKKTAVPKP